MIREPAVAGAFYPGQPAVLGRDIRGYLEKVTLPDIPQPIALVVPHAGYIYSGPVAAWSYALLEKIKPEVVMVLALSHRYRFDGASVMPEGFYRTPLGDMPIEQDVATSLLDHEGFLWTQEADREEHSLEVQVPFIQVTSPGSSLVAVTVGTSDYDICMSLGEALAHVWSQVETSKVLIISTDLSHFYSQQRAEKLDRNFINALMSMDTRQVHESVASGSSEACGVGPVLAGLSAAQKMGASRFHELHYGTSGDTSGDMDRVVGYLAGAMI